MNCLCFDATAADTLRIIRDAVGYDNLTTSLYTIWNEPVA